MKLNKTMTDTMGKGIKLSDGSMSVGGDVKILHSTKLDDKRNKRKKLGRSNTSVSDTPNA